MANLRVDDSSLVVEVNEYFTPPKTVREALQKARKVISDEKRWAEGVLYSPPDDNVHGGMGFGTGREDSECSLITCKNVRVCAVGALGLVIDNGAIIYDELSGKRDTHEFLSRHKIGGPALELLDAAASKVLREDYDWEPTTNPDPRGGNVVNLNDDVAHLESILKAFDIAIVNAQKKERLIK